MSERPTRSIALSDLLDRLLDTGVVVRGKITISVADVDMIHIDAALLVAAADRAVDHMSARGKT